MPSRVAARLVAKAWAQHGSVRVLTPGEALTAQLDGLLWKVPATGFLPQFGLKETLQSVRS